MQFSALSDLTSYVQNNDNVQRQQRKAMPLPPAEPRTPPVAASRAAVRINNPYSAQVLPVRYHAPTPVYTLPPPPPPSFLNLSNESATSSTSSTSSPTFIVHTPVRREYRNGRPVPVFTSNH